MITAVVVQQNPARTPDLADRILSLFGLAWSQLELAEVGRGTGYYTTALSRQWDRNKRAEFIAWFEQAAGMVLAQLDLAPDLLVAVPDEDEY